MDDKIIGNEVACSIMGTIFLVIIREYGSTLYVGLARALSLTNTTFRLTFLLTRLQDAVYEDLAVWHLLLFNTLNLFLT